MEQQPASAIGEKRPGCTFGMRRLVPVAVRYRQKAMEAIGRHAQTDDLTGGIDGPRDQEVQPGRVGGNEPRGVQVRDRAVLPKDCPWSEGRIQGGSDHLASVVDAETEARIVTWKHAEGFHTCPPGPQETVKGCVIGQFRMADHLTRVIDCAAVVAGDSSDAAEVAKVSHRPVSFPQQRMIFHEIQAAIRIEGGATARRADGLTVVVNRSRDSIRIDESLPVRVDTGCRERLNPAVSPDDRLELANRTAGGGSVLAVSAIPATSPRLLIEYAEPFAPPSVGSLVIKPFCQTKGRHAVEDGNPKAL